MFTTYALIMCGTCVQHMYMQVIVQVGGSDLRAAHVSAEVEESAWQGQVCRHQEADGVHQHDA